MPELRIKKQLPGSQADELSRLQEETAKLIDKERIPNQDAYEKEEVQRGVVLLSNEVISRIIAMNRSLWVEDSVNCPGHANFYYFDRKTRMKACAGAPFKKGPIREFSVVFHDTAGRPVGVEYGWREILNRLMRRGLVSWPQAATAFPLYEKQQSGDFDRQARKFKN